VSASTHVFTGRLVERREDAAGPVGSVSVRGARVVVALDLVPDAREGDSLLVHAGVALAVLGGPLDPGPRPQAFPPPTWGGTGGGVDE